MRFFRLISSLTARGASLLLSFTLLLSLGTPFAVRSAEAASFAGTQDGHGRVTPHPLTNGHRRNFDTTPPRPLRGAPPNLPNIEEARTQSTSAPQTPTVITANSENTLEECLGDCGGALPPPGSNPTDPNLSNPRTEPRNETGQSGVDLGSRNFNWSLPLVSLKGRAGLDLGITLVYNSLVWTKSGSVMRFNADRGFPGPGFRLGFPAMQPLYTNDQGVSSYLMITSSGGRVELRQKSAGVFESADGGYTQLTVNGGGGATVRTSDGTQLVFTPSVDNEMRCTEIKDRNGNFITIYYNSLGRPLKVVDTLGREIFFNYDSANYLRTITQLWNGQSRTWAAFDYTPLVVYHNFWDSNVHDDGFTGQPSIEGPANGESIPVLLKVALPDGSSYVFEYNCYGQVYRINHHAPDTTKLASATYNLPGDASAQQADCPRFTERRDWINDGILSQDGEVVTRYNEDSQAVCGQATLPDGTVPCKQITLPDNTVHKEFYATTGWQKGLTTGTEVRAGGELKKSTATVWTQDDENLPYQQNPRPVQLIVDDGSNRRQTNITYVSFSGISLPDSVEEFGGTPTSVTSIRRTTTHYYWENHYLSRRVIGLVNAQQVYDTSVSPGALVSKTTYGYDWDWNGDMFVDTPSAATQHDRTNYPPSFKTGRGNLSQVARWDVNDPDNASKATETKFRVNSTGAVVLERDHLLHETAIDYADSFSVAGHSATFAYPTKITDAEGYAATTQYNYDNGSVTQTLAPGRGTLAAGNVQYVEMKMEYDGAGRIQKATNVSSGSYTRRAYQPNMLSVHNYTTIKDAATEAYTINALDGAGRVRATATEHPGSAGGHRAVYVDYDEMGRVVSRSNPTEVTDGWAPTGDDAAWVLTKQTYDWQGRPLLTTNPGGSTRSAAYDGCGCAGGERVTLRDERGRQRRLSKDSLGRLVKTEEFDLNEIPNIYTTATYTYNARDQLTKISHEGQERTLQYDGYGRLWKRTTPEQGTVEYTYNEDDTLKTERDARGVVASYLYTARHQPREISYNTSQAVNVPPTSTVSMSYDAAGNRTSLSNAASTTSYAYDALSRLESETQTFAGLSEPQFLSYQYNLAGQLTQLRRQYSLVVNYVRDRAGQVTGITGSGYVDDATYASGIHYRASGALKQVSYPNGRQLSLAYDDRMRLTQWSVPGVLGWQYGYDYFDEKTARVTYAKNLYNGTTPDPTLDRSYDYDHVGRLINSYTGSESRAHLALPDSQSGTQDGPYAQGYSYDKKGNLTQRQGWGGWNAAYTYTYDAKNRNTLMQYDAAGNVTGDGSQLTYDATGQQVRALYAPAGGWDIQQGYDGDRLRVKKTENGAVTYYLRSSILGGQVVAEFNQTGTWLRGYVYDGGGQLLALQAGGVRWVHQDPVTKSQRVTNKWGTTLETIDLDPWGGETTRTQSTGVQPRKYTTYDRDANGRDQAMMRSYHGWFSRFDQPDPFDGSYDLADTQSFNRYAYVGNDPVNRTDPSGLDWDDDAFAELDASFTNVPGGRGGGGGGGGGSFSFSSNSIASSPEERLYEQRLQNTYDAIAANRALQQFIRSEGMDSGAQARFLALMAANTTLVLQANADVFLRFRTEAGLMDIFVGNKFLVTIDAESGKGDCMNNPDCARRRNEGPLPQGLYYINASEISQPGLLRTLTRNNPINGADWGSFRVPIHPASGTNTFGRDGFMLHGGSLRGSAGCIDIGGGLRGDSTTSLLLRTLRADPNGSIGLRVLR